MHSMETQPPRIRFLKPHVALRDVVRFYTQREASLPDTELVHPVPARAATMLEFIFSEPFEIHWCDRPAIETTPRAVVVGLQTHRRVRLVMRGRLESFSVVFQPAGLFRLFSIPAAELTNRDYDAHAVIGGSVSSLHQRLGECHGFEGRARIADQFLLAVLQTGQTGDGVLDAANHVLRAHGGVRINDLAARTGYSLRQFERRFAERIGVSPKLYARIARFEAALDSRARSQGTTWTDIAHAFGYYDQMHLIHDFERFSGETPGNLLTEVEHAHRASIDAVRRGRLSAPRPDAPRLLL
jgi:AraC-like DNA-binding protein